MPDKGLLMVCTVMYINAQHCSRLDRSQSSCMTLSPHEQPCACAHSLDFPETCQCLHQYENNSLSLSFSTVTRLIRMEQPETAKSDRERKHCVLQAQANSRTIKGFLLQKGHTHSYAEKGVSACLF